MARKKKRVVKKYKKLPPHTWEAHPIANAGEIRKSFVIGIITIGALLLLSLFLFFGQDLVGQAIHFEDAPAEVNAAGVFVKEEVKFDAVGDKGSVPVKIYVPGTASGFEFDLTYDKEILELECPETDLLDDLFNNGKLGLHSNIDCRTPGKLSMEYVGLPFDQDRISQGDVVVDLTFKAKKEGETQVDFSKFIVYDANTGDEFKGIAINSPKFVVGKKTVTKPIIVALEVQGALLQTKVVANQKISEKFWIITNLYDEKGNVVAYNRELVKSMDLNQEYISMMYYQGKSSKKVVDVYQHPKKNKKVHLAKPLEVKSS